MGHPGDVRRTVREVVVDRGRVTTGWFRARPGDLGFGGGTTDRAIVVFPRTAVGIRHQRRAEVVADATTAMLYNPGDSFHRRLIDPVGDRCEWVSIPGSWWERLCHDVDPEGRMHDRRFRDGRVFTVDHCPLPDGAYLRQRRLTTGLARDALSTLAVEETALSVLGEVLEAGARRRPVTDATQPSTAGRHRRLVQDTREYLGSCRGVDVDLAGVAEAVGSSPWHLHRVFRSRTGTTIHAHQTSLRLRTALGWLPDRELAAIAHDLGFSSHSHFTATFRRAFGRTPSEVRATLAS